MAKDTTQKIKGVAILIMIAHHFIVYDALFCWEVLLSAKSFCITNRVLYHVVMHSDSSSGGGSYKPIRKDCITVWSIISEEAAKIDKTLGNMAKAQLANMAFFSLYEMDCYGFEDNIQEDAYCKKLSANILCFQRASFIPRRLKIMAQIATISKRAFAIAVRMRYFVRNK